MAGDDYSPVVSGSLKLKGSKPSGVGKKKKKKSKPDASAGVADEKKLAIQKALEEDDHEITKDLAQTADEVRDDVKNALEAARKDKGSELSSEEIREVEERQLGSRKTEAERRMEETRRKRLIQRLEKEGIKTHKERVEELNTYLSRLSEHHDMPRIGPG